jgi:phage-related protein (TIGR01555 family)
MNIKNWFKRKELPVEQPKEERWSTFSTDDMPMGNVSQMLAKSLEKSIQVPPTLYKENAVGTGVAMDAGLGQKFGFQWGYTVAPAQASWYASQGFIGYQTAAIMAQHWLVAKCCLMPAEDAVRNGYDITVNDGTEVPPEVLDEMRKADERFRINQNMVQLIQMGRVFGIRIAMFEVDVPDPDDYYFKPFNPDGVTPGSYRGISQVDPYWMTPELDAEAAGNPASKYFYEPTWWRINGRRIHRTHLVIYRTEEVPDILKPTYIYGGIPIPQKVYERVYAAERTANEAPMLAMTKRLDVLKVDLSAAAAKEGGFKKRMDRFVYGRDNFGVKAIGLQEDMQQFDTGLADLDAVIMTQYQIVAAACNVPSVKLLGTSPKGFNTTGEFEESNYHEMLESLQAHGLTPLVERHHLLLIRSEIAPMFNLQPFSTTITWNPLDAMTGKELAELNKLKADTGQVLMSSGAIDGQDERNRIINDPESGYTGLDNEMPQEEILSNPLDE